MSTRAFRRSASVCFFVFLPMTAAVVGTNPHVKSQECLDDGGSALGLFQRKAKLNTLIEKAASDMLTGTVVAPTDEQISAAANLWLSPRINVTAFGNNDSPVDACSYPGLLIPDPTKPLGTMSRTQLAFDVTDYSEFAFRVGAFKVLAVGPQARLMSLPVLRKTAEVAFNFIAENSPKKTATSKGVKAVQGSDGAWKSDKFASELVAHTFMAAFLQPANNGSDLVLDLTDDGPAPTKLHQLKQVTIRAAGANWLRSRAYLSSGATPRLVAIDVLLAGGQTVTLRPSDGVKWSLAKVIVHSLAGFMIQGFHAGVHLYAGLVMASFQRALPHESLLHGVGDPLSLRVANTLLRVVSLLHADHRSALAGGVFNTTSIEDVRAGTVEIARWFLDVELWEVLGLSNGQTPPSWWAGGAYDFIAPIETFAAGIAAGTMADTGSATYLQGLQDQLTFTGLLTGASGLDVRTPGGVQKLYRNLLYLQSVFHGSMLYSRELITPLALLSTTELTQFLLSPLPPLLVNGALTRAFPIVTEQEVEYAFLTYGVSGGYANGPELGDGPYFNADPVSNAINIFRAQLSGVRWQIFSRFGTSTGGFTPSYYYPKEAPRPFGYSMSQSAFI